jgi:release factor glutamine methyltransferase
MSRVETWTILRLIEWTMEHLKRHGSDSPRLDAEVLLAHARQCQRIQLYTAFNQEPEESVKAAFRELVRRRADGTPVAYLVGHKEFYSVRFRVSPDVLIPRPETEHLVIEAIDKARLFLADPIRMADVGTGSGCVAISLAKHLKSARILATDLSPQAIAIAQSNAQQHEVADRVEVLQCDLLPTSETGPFHLIVSNPPYVSEKEYAQLAKEVREHEPRMALVAGPQGTEVIGRLMNTAKEHLVPGGWLLVELSPMIAERVEGMFRADPQWNLERVAKDLAGLPRIALAQLNT